jgi:signal transduction histidine kinase
MIWTIIEIIAIIAESFLALSFNVGYFRMKSDKYYYLKILGGTIILSLWDYFGTMLVKTEFLAMSGFAAILFVFSLLFLKDSAFEKFIIAVISCTLFYLINLPILYAFSFIYNQAVYDITLAKGIERIVILFLTKMMYLFVTQLIIYFRQKQIFLFKRDEWIMISSSFTITFVIAFFLYSLSINLWNRLYVFIAIVFLLTVLDVLSFKFMRKINQKNTEQTKNELLRLSLKQQSEMIDRVKVQYDSISEMRHNYVHELAYIQGVLDEKNYSKLDEYLKEKLSSEKLKGYNYIFTSNKVIDSVINYKFSIAEQKGISVVCTLTVEIPEAFEHDVSIILSNLLDNAIEASEKGKTLKPEIILNVSETSGYYSILVKNRIDKSVISDNKHFQTTKADKQHHGYGLKTVRMIAKAHNGMTDIYEKNDFFIVHVMLNS